VTSSPSTLPTIQRELAACGLKIIGNDRVGRVLRVLAATRTNGVVLQVGVHALEYAPWIIDGMDITTRLILNVDGPAPSEQLQPLFRTDLRVTLHHQDTRQFLGDVARHRFDLIVLDPSAASDEILSACLQVLDSGGLLVIIGDGGDPADAGVFSNCHVVSLGELTIVAQVAPHSKPTRKGGRSARRQQR